MLKVIKGCEPQAIMKRRYLLICVVGDNSLHSNWFNNEDKFDILTIYYGNCPRKGNYFKQNSKFYHSSTGNKYNLISNVIHEQKVPLNDYEYIWCPDDDLLISSNDVFNFLEISRDKQLLLSQPSMKGFVSHKITKPRLLHTIRFTNFVEVIAPLFRKDIFCCLLYTFNFNESGWGLDFLWPKLLGYPKDKIAIIDSIQMVHTKCIGRDYSRFEKHPAIHLTEILNKFDINYYEDNSRNFIVYSRVILGLQFGF